MDYFYITEKFVLAPEEFHNPAAIQELFSVSSREQIKHLQIPLYKAVLTFTEPEEAKEHDKTGNNLYPVIYRLITRSGEIQDHNKIILHFNPQKGIMQIVAAEGDKLLLANSYKSPGFTTALYFISLVIQQVQFNPQLTKIHVCGSIGPDGEHLLEQYFQGIRVDNDFSDSLL